MEGELGEELEEGEGEVVKEVDWGVLDEREYPSSQPPTPPPPPTTQEFPTLVSPAVKRDSSGLPSSVLVLAPGSTAARLLLPFASFLALQGHRVRYGPVYGPVSDPVSGAPRSSSPFCDSPLPSWKLIRGSGGGQEP